MVSKSFAAFVALDSLFDPFPMLLIVLLCLLIDTTSELFAFFLDVHEEIEESWLGNFVDNPERHVFHIGVWVAYQRSLNPVLASDFNPCQIEVKIDLHSLLIQLFWDLNVVLLQVLLVVIDTLTKHPELS